MVRPSGHRGDADLGPVTDRTVNDLYLHAPIVVRPRIPYRSATQEPILKFRGQLRQIWVEFFYQMLGAAPQDSSCSTHGYSHAEHGIEFFRVIRLLARSKKESDPYIFRERGMRETVYVAPVAPARGSDGRPRHGKGKGLTGRFMSVMKVARDVLAPTQNRKKMKASDWEHTEAAKGGPVDPELIPSYGGHVAGRIWR
ncbi:hypothetical protein M9H77_33341 [Catharanthus roseus]|uniref:Uncharacterized protein n=1 Tax=Catharanthus roseus TaxID=4058 RepID=A0ACB9ZKI5_CATRO|nr:hypothetical protein M9H77_33341 [Catharanthus roseus]